jgi:hypothetical protein
MKNPMFVIVFFCCLPLGCAAISEQAKMKAYELTMDSYETAMRVSDFNAACRYVDPSEMDRNDCLKRYDRLKIVNYEVIAIDLADEKRVVNQTVEVEYYFLDRYIAKKKQYEQSWRYKEDGKSWILKTGPPQFK